MATIATDYATECREAFARLAAEHAAINPAERGHRNENAKLRARKHAAIDHTLDQWLAFRAVSDLDWPAPDVHLERASE